MSLCSNLVPACMFLAEYSETLFIGSLVISLNYVLEHQVNLAHQYIEL